MGDINETTHTPFKKKSFPRNMSPHFGGKDGGEMTARAHQVWG